MSRRATGFALVVVVTAALAGCVGIPTSGGVVAGPPIDETQAADFIPLPNGPQEGASQEEILQDFITAATSPAGDYAIARLFLASGIKDAWDPDKGVVVRTGAATVSRTSDTALQYTSRAAATVDETGRYSEYAALANDVRQFEFAQVGGEWRISAAPDGIVLSQNSFGSVFNENALYFFDPTYHYLVPDVRWFPSRATIPDRIVRALLAGPTSWLQSGVVLSEFPPATKLETSVDILSGTATVDLSAEAATANPTQRERMRQQLAATLGTLSSGVSNVVMTVGGVPLEVPDSVAPAVQNPTVETAPLVEVAADGAAPEFGFPGADGGVAPISGISDKVIALGPTGVALSSDQRTAAVLNGAGVSAVVADSVNPTLVDDRAGLIAPSIDSQRYIWSAPGSSAAGLTAFGADGTRFPIASNLPVDARIVSIDVSRDGARILLYLQSDVGARLAVAGIIRSQGVPTALGELYELPAPAGTALDATWVDNRTVAALYRIGSASLVTAFELGGPSTQLGDANGGTTIAGGNNGTSGLRVLAQGGILRPQGSGGWQDTGLTALLLGTQQ